MWSPFTSRRSKKPSPTPSRPPAARPRPTVEALEGRTLLSFTAPVTSAGGRDSLAVADFNRDGRDDVAVFDARGAVAVSLGNGDGTFRPASTLKGLTGDPVRIDTGDVNGDGKPDVTAWGFRASSKGPTPKTSGGCLQSCGGGTPSPIG